MADLKTSGIVIGLLAAAIWGIMYFRSGGASSGANLILMFGGALAATLLALDWAESYTS